MSKKMRTIPGMRSVSDGIGTNCPKCRRPMLRMRHSEDWAPRPDQWFWYEFWDRCVKCGYLQHFEVAKRFNSDPVPVAVSISAPVVVAGPAGSDNLSPGEWEFISGRPRPDCQPSPVVTTEEGDAALTVEEWRALVGE